MDLPGQRRELLDTARSVNRRGLSQGTTGNLSVRLADGFLITPSALPYEACHAEDMVRINMDGEVRGQRKPSTEWRLHRDVYANRPEAGAILHAHPPWCTTLACLEREIPAFHYMVAIAGGDNIRCAPYAIFGSQALSDSALLALRGRTACLLAHHGMVCFAAAPARVLDLGLEIEALAGVYVRTLQIGEPKLLGPDEMQKVLDRFADYRNRR
ncbi:L-fuculose phosphate aldolase [bacterium BMS3Bbin14]|nr:L-fuculose phosphate aldolase [bacterium BMS3Abin13]GBE51577.1 L-fuculose phosphate aldolase [bacterium BMS3Bbin14]HDK43675.1 class II aldolase [Desulfobacteraceae bacterium]HDZ75914.1 class II aldolase [Desulfobacteraceae bacterium]